MVRRFKKSGQQSIKIGSFELIYKGKSERRLTAWTDKQPFLKRKKIMIKLDNEQINYFIEETEQLKAENIEVNEEEIMNKLAKDILDKKAYICCPRACGKRTFFKKLSIAILEEQARRLQQSEVEE